jgi:hypothetical protein
MDGDALRVFLTALVLSGFFTFIAIYLCLFLDSMRIRNERAEDELERARNERVQPKNIDGGNGDLLIHRCAVRDTGDSSTADQWRDCDCWRVHSGRSSCRVLGSDWD